MTLLKKLTIGTAMTAMAFAGATGAHAMDDMKMDNGGAMMNSSMTTPTMMPMLVSGTVQNYYVDRAGYVSAMDVQTADGVKMVRFSPSMAQRVTALYPVGSSASVYVTSSMMGKMTNYDLAGVGPDMPTPSTMMMPSNINPIDVLKSTPYIQMGTKEKTYKGKISGYISDPMSGEVLGIVLNNKTLIRIPMQNRLIQASTSPTGVTPLFAGSDVVATGYEESPLYGVVSPFEKRVAASSISVNGEALGALGFGKLMSSRKPLLGFNLNFFGGKAPKDMSMQTNSMGYTTYDMSKSMGNGAMMNNGATMNNGTAMNNGAMMNNGTTMDNGTMMNKDGAMMNNGTMTNDGAMKGGM